MVWDWRAGSAGEFSQGSAFEFHALLSAIGDPESLWLRIGAGNRRGSALHPPNRWAAAGESFLAAVPQRRTAQRRTATIFLEQRLDEVVRLIVCG